MYSAIDTILSLWNEATHPGIRKLFTEHELEKLDALALQPEVDILDKIFLTRMVWKLLRLAK